ncbi:MAG: phosphate ABC transporter permease subunit PstC [Gammaproteobacteria bacterium]|uniref:phosphate ABC transporter permease subunit PstC n=1 Tax=Pseudomaricurvus alcaniphilus TaxID=1166482 RepID=UPI0014075932|nr:phosphate ABC transporter permease subunit PstC [Pseudomaricurvus alcaniphilus]MBR9909929.1 phosphate ABC transporter permease subunit PstC [Gammaproteobacteria bacterium]NHN38853.1 phosphate ABC transporter permease subunit PstC [Pseudomaricurvus alcaniphilus]
MNTSSLLLTIVVLIAVAYFFGRRRSVSLADTSQGGYRNLNSLPFYYGTLTALWCGIPALLVVALWLVFDNTIIDSLILAQLPEPVRALPDGELGLVLNSIKNLAAENMTAGDPEPYVVAAADSLNRITAISQMAMAVLGLTLGMSLAVFSWFRIQPQQKARLQVEKVFKFILLSCASIAILTTVGIVFSVIFESLRFFQAVPFTEFIFGTHWSPQMAIRADQVGSSGAFGIIPLFTGTLLISAIALIVAVPTGLMTAIYLSEYASSTVRSIVKPLLEVLAGIPTVVYGFFAALTIAPLIRDGGAWTFEFLGLQMAISSESALAAGLVMGVMIIPFVSSLSDDVINAVPQALRDGSFGLGATRSETIKQVVLPAALPGIVGSVLLAASRAIGETMIVVMAAGLAANLTANPLESVTTVTVQIVTLLVGDQEFDSPKTLAAFALGLMLFIVTLALNYLALHVVKKYREQYE